MLSPGRSKPSTSNDAAPGTKPQAARFPSRLGVVDEPLATPDRSQGHATHSGKTPATSTDGNVNSSTGSPKPTRNCGGAYLLKEGLRYVFAVKGTEGKEALDKWLTWARRSQLPSFIELAKKITRHRQAIDANLDHGLSQGLIESTNTKIRLLTRIAFGFHGPQPLIALALLALGNHPPQLPGRK